MGNLTGSEKQIKWAEDIRAGILKNNIDGDENEIVEKAIKYIEKIEIAKFWIDYKSADIKKMLQQLGNGILRINGLNSSRTARILKTGEIIETWKEIVNDGKGGHWEQKTKLVKII